MSQPTLAKHSLKLDCGCSESTVTVSWHLTAEHRCGYRGQPWGTFEPAVANELLHGGDVDLPLLCTSVHPRGVDVHAHDMLCDAAVAVLVPVNEKCTGMPLHTLKITTIKSVAGDSHIQR